MFSSHSFWTSSSLDVPAGVIQEEGHTGFLINLLSAVLALIFLARRIQPFLSLVDREVEFCALTIQSFSTRWAFYFLFFIFLVRKSRLPGSNSRPNVSEGYEVPLSYRGDRHRVKRGLKTALASDDEEISSTLKPHVSNCSTAAARKPRPGNSTSV